MIALEMDLPWPPSTNHLFLTRGRKRVLSPEARAYRKSVGENLTLQRIPLRQLSGRLGVSLDLYPPHNRAFDIDNRIKAVLDALQTFEVFQNDNQIDELKVSRRSLASPVGHISAWIWEIRKPTASP